MRHVLIALTLVSIYVWAYSSVFSAELLYEDHHLINGTERRLGPSSLPNISFDLQHNATPLAYHVVNLALHLLVVALVGVWFVTLGLSASASWFGVIVTLLHPLAVEATAYVINRAELISTVLMLIACIVATVGMKRQWFLITSVSASLLALLAGFGKETGLAVVPVVITIIAVKKSLKFALVGTVAIIFAFVGLWLGHVGWAERAVTTMVNREGTSLGFVWAIDIADWLRWQATSAVRMIGLIPVPRGQSVVFDVWLVPVSLQWLSVAWLVALAVGAWVLRRSYAMFSLGLAWMLLMIAPRLWVQTPSSIFNEGQFYLAMPGAALIAATLWGCDNRKELV